MGLNPKAKQPQIDKANPQKAGFPILQDVYFLQIVPPPENKQFFLDQEANVQHILGDQTLQVSHPHISLVNIFPESDNETELTAYLNQIFSKISPFEVALDGFGAFWPHTIYYNLKDPTATKALCDAICASIDDIQFQREYIPHLTLIRRLHLQQFKKLWPCYRDKHFEFNFRVSEVVLLKTKADMEKSRKYKTIVPVEGWKKVAEFKLSG